MNQPQEGPTIDVEKLPNPARKRKSTFTPPAFATRKGESGGPLPVSMRNRRVRQDRSIVKAEPSEIEKLKPVNLENSLGKPVISSLVGFCLYLSLIFGSLLSQLVLKI